MKTLTCVMAHKEAQKTVNRHTPYWIGDQSNHLIFTSPVNSMVSSVFPVVGLGLASHHSPEAIARFRQILIFLASMEYEWFILHEYDSLGFGACLETPSDNALYSNLFTSDQKWFKGHHYTHPPIQCSRRVMQALAERFMKVPNTIEGSFWDRAVGLICEEAGIELKGYGALGFAWNTIEPEHLPSAVEARRKGAVWFHGIKDARTLHALEHAKP